MFIEGLRINEAEYDLENGEKGKFAIFCMVVMKIQNQY
jgi:hypothetical protein